MGNIKRARLIEGRFPEEMNNNLKFDVVVMNEFLHLFNPEDALQLIKDAKTYLNEGGRIIITENLKTEHLAYRLAKLGGGYLYSPRDLGCENEATYLNRHWVGVIHV